MKKLILGFLCIAAVIFVVCSMCAWDKGNIGFGRLIIQAAIGVAVEWFALKNM